MNHPYLYPDEAPWTEDYEELRAIRRLHRRGVEEIPKAFEDLIEFEDALFGVI